jgi:phospholipase C
VASVRDLAHANPEIRATDDRKNNALCLTLINRGNAVCEFSISSNAYRADGPWKFSVRAGHTRDTLWSVSASGNWYDLSVTVDVQPAFLRRLAGRMENGYDLVSDPAAA